MGDLANAVGFSTAYVYKFFDSKQAIGEAICRIWLARIASHLQTIVSSDRSSSERFRDVFLALSAHAREMALREARLQEMIIAAHQEGWQSFKTHNEVLRALIMQIVEDGRRIGEFERETPIEEACTGILLVLEPFRNPTLWGRRLDELDEQAACLAALVLRSLAPG